MERLLFAPEAYIAPDPAAIVRRYPFAQFVTETALGQVCTPFDEGGRFATESDDLEEKFPCMANVGTSGSPIEQPVTALIASFEEDKRGPGDCNEDFLRDDAILVVVIVTDDPPYDFDMDDAHPLTDTSHWYEDVIAGKNNDPEALVVIGFIPWGDTSCVFGGGLGSYAGGLLYDLGRSLGLPALPWLIFAMIGVIAAAGLSWTLLGSGRAASGAAPLRRERRMTG